MICSRTSWSRRIFGALILTACSAGISAQTLVYEREFSLAGLADNTLRISLSHDDRLVIERPAFMTHAGRFEAVAPEGTYQRLADEIAGTARIARSVNEDIQRRAASELIYVTDPEYTRFLMLGNQRQVVEAVEATSLEAWRQHFDDDIRIARLVDLERDWLDLMEQALRTVDR